MGLLSSLARAFGYVPPVEPREPGPFAIGPSAMTRIAALPPRTIVRVTTTPVAGGHLAVAREEPGEPAGLTISELDRALLVGRVLEFDGSRYAASLALRIEPWETPNPDSRRYEVDRPLAYGRARFFSGTSVDVPPLGVRLLAIPGVVAALVRDNTVTIERATGSSWTGLDRAVDACLREYFLFCGAALPDRGALPEREGLVGRIERVVADRIAPGIQRDGGDIEVVDATDGVVRVHLMGACRTCPASEATLKLAVERTLREAFPGDVVRVESI